MRPRLMRDLTVPSGSPRRSAISWYDSSCRSRSTTAVRSVIGSVSSAWRSCAFRAWCFGRASRLRLHVLVLDLRVGPALGRGRLQVVRVDVARDRLPLLAHTAVVVDAE